VALRSANGAEDFIDACDGFDQQIGSTVDAGVECGIRRRRSGDSARACGGRIVREVRPRNRSGGQMIAKRARRGRLARFILEKHLMDQRNDRDPGNRTGRDRAILESASGRTEHCSGTE
jgi:hypothetical protein